ncbi:MAG: hypothetical protein ABR907_02500 [Terracidiphilus sp.]|jgi:hypothetical protein
MRIAHRQLYPKQRRRLIVANISLVLGILLWNFQRWGWIHSTSPFEQNWLDALSGFLFCLYITIYLLTLRRGNCSGQSQNS